MNILGHERILELLPALRAQSFLFTGPEGVGRRAVARWYAWQLNGEHYASDYLEIAPEGETKGGKKARKPQILLEQIAPREEGGENLLDWLSTYPRHRAKVAVIDGAHLLNEPAGNALLKILEEPPAYARIVLIAPSRELVLPTLTSRSLEIAFGPLPLSILRQLSTDPEVLAYAEGAVGRVRWALEHPLEFQKLLARAEGVMESLRGARSGPAQTQQAFKALGELDNGLDYLARRLGEIFPPESPRRREALEALAQAQEALSAYAGEELTHTWLALRLWRLANWQSAGAQANQEATK
ncbi:MULTISPECIES: hypothetical protein [unclassified Meiothermus]|uniref:hypothetical protein n=1 Tax=unclassified Meiothermus TaxID=370471 RepID=UPI000D7C72BA|nr:MULTISPECIES: hypothetical protein [unclassified Meiothermus]PZA06162.1 hypothetical protein DNA98_14965 [Meiothermus sp. Pnk-1]RYM36197.1 hypothetical protein EWH23_10875 [Meiothermus sp. PNK-Is4]